jgi:mono/diheme cytochrome c family protein
VSGLEAAAQRRGRLRIVTVVVLGLLVAAGGVVAGVVALNLRDEAPIVAVDDSALAAPATIARGEYLARAGNCMACHTERGGALWAGGRGIETPFGVVHSSNLTPDRETGLGEWTSAHFWRALHNGRSKDGRLLYPAFPYTHYTRVTRADADAIFAYLKVQPAVARPNAAHRLRFPYGTQPALAVWRVLYFRPDASAGLPAPPAMPGVSHGMQDAEALRSRGAYLARGLGHCTACHGPRNAWGATDPAREWSGGMVPMQRWYAPSLRSEAEAGVATWPIEDVVRLLRDGVSGHGSVLGPMAEVVYRSTQYLDETDLHALVAFLQALPPEAPRPDPGAPALAAEAKVVALGERLYAQHCADCHGKSGEGVAGAYPALAGNRAVTMANPANVIRVVLSGGFAPSTAGNPRPHGMPPFAHLMTDEQVAALVTWLRLSWGNKASQVTFSDVVRYR